MQDQSSTVSFCPSFSSYSKHNSNHHHLIAARVGDEESRINDDDEEFQFILPRASISLPDKGKEETKLVLPLFKRDLLLSEESGADVAPPSPRFSPSRLVSLGQLFLEDRGEEDPPSLSSSEAGEDEEGDGTSPRTSCIWKLNFSPSPARCQKSNSTGSSSAAASKSTWRFRNLLRRSSSDGLESNYLFVNPIHNNNNNNKAERSKTASSPLHLNKAKGKGQLLAHEALYGRDKALREGDKRRSYLPYRRDLVGLLTFPDF